MLFYKYFEDWIDAYKVGSIAPVTLAKYRMANKRLAELAPKLQLKSLDRKQYQQLINNYAVTHERQTTMDWHHQLKACLMDAKDDGLIVRDPTRKVVIKGKMPGPKKLKYLNKDELQKLLSVLPLEPNKVGWDWLILLLAKTGLRFAEGLGLTPNDFDFAGRKLSVEKTWNYKIAPYGFAPTKNTSSIRVITIDSLLAYQFKQLTRDLPQDEPIFINPNVRIFNSTFNSMLGRYCNEANVPVISAHCLRHTHASVLIAAGVSIPTVSKRLGHSNITTTQNTYLHIIRELEEKDRDKAMDCMSSLCG